MVVQAMLTCPQTMQRRPREETGASESSEESSDLSSENDSSDENIVGTERAPVDPVCWLCRLWPFFAMVLSQQFTRVVYPMIYGNDGRRSIQNPAPIRFPRALAVVTVLLIIVTLCRAFGAPRTQKDDSLVCD